jgi:hypothetical protein
MVLSDSLTLGWCVAFERSCKSVLVVKIGVALGLAAILWLAPGVFSARWLLCGGIWWFIVFCESPRRRKDRTGRARKLC